MWLGDATTTADGSVPGVSSDVSTWTDLTKTLAPLATTIFTALDQQKLLDYNISLINAGKPPLTADQLVQLQSGFTPQVNVGLGSGTLTAVEDIAIGAGLLVAALFVINQLSGGSAARSRTMARAYNR